MPRSNGTEGPRKASQAGWTLTELLEATTRGLAGRWSATARTERNSSDSYSTSTSVSVAWPSSTTRTESTAGSSSTSRIDCS
ncbi:hypothetical protein [Streptomyces europaeiscabiei]|uniref:hypothetical protein n=1 Tax=Streptomyces europaeiscabiei TaxID=146819 RepID=UPI002E2AFEA8|nr:hypothetical protein [Streptomyces europaeiscabiei]